MDLDPRLSWAPRYHLDTLPTGLWLDGELVAFLMQRVDGSWFCRLEVQKPIDCPDVLRDCSGFDQGRRGCEIWAMRHLERLAAEVEAKKAGYAYRRWGSRPPPDRP